MSSKGKRSSILKKRPSMGAGSLESSPTEATTTMTRATKRIGFKPKKSVKEFFASDETATIWCNSYELSAEGTPLHVTVNDTTTAAASTTIKDETGSRQDKENVEVDNSSRRNSINSSAWNLSVSVSEEEKRRMKSEISMNSSVLNVTDRLTLEPTTMVAPRPVLSQRQNELLPDSSAMDVSPAKATDGRMNSPRKTIYFHPKQNMFITIDDVVSNDHKRPALPAEPQPSPNDTDINFFGPSGPRSSNQPEPPAKVLFQTSSTSAGSMTTNPWRNKSIQTSDISTGWTSHAGIEPPPNSTNQPRYTFYNSQLEISEAWNSHPAAALKLRMLQQGLEPPPDFDDPRISGGGGGGGSNRNSDVDTTLAITQTVAKMLQRPSSEGGGVDSRTVSLESTRVSDGGGRGGAVVIVDDDDDEPEAMEVTCGKETPHVDIPMQTDDDDGDDQQDLHQQPPSLEASVSDILLPPNALSRARPSFIPSAAAAAAVPMDESYCPSPEPNHSKQVDSKRETLAQPIPMEEVPMVEKAATRHTVFGTQMEIVGKKDEVKPVAAPPELPLMETIKVDLADLVFARNSIGLDLLPVVATPAEVNRPKIHRIAPRALGFNFGEATPSSNVKQVVQPPPSRGTIYTAEVAEQTRVEEVEDRQPRKTIVQSLDVSMASPVEESVAAQKGRGTVFASEDVNESAVEEAKKTNHLRPTMLFNEKLEVSKLEPRSGSLEDLRKYGQSRKTILSSGDEDVIVLDSPDVTKRLPLVKSSQRGTLLVNGDMDQTRRTPEQQLVVPKSRPTTVGAINMEQDISPVTVPSRFTIYDGDRMDESRIKDLISPEVSAQPVATKSRQTCYSAEMDETVPIGGVSEVVANLPRKSVLQQVNMDETCRAQQSLAMNETGFDQQQHQAVNRTEVMDARSSNRTLQKSRQTSFDDVQAINETRAQQDSMDETKLQKSWQTSFAAQVINETARPSVVQQIDSEKLQKSRQTNFVLQDMNETGVIQQADGCRMQSSFDVHGINETRVQEVMASTARSSNKALQKSRKTSFDVQAMNETRVGGQIEEANVQKSRQTSFDVQAMNRTASPASSQQVQMEESLRPEALEQSRASRTLQKSRQTSFAVQEMNETRVGSSSEQQVVDRTEIMDNTAKTSNRTLQKPRQTSFDVQDMNETKVGTDQLVVNRTQEVMVSTTKASNWMLQKSRQTSFAVQDMNETGRVSPGQNLQSEIEMGESAWQLSRSQFGKSVVDPLEQSKDLQKSRQTSFAVKQMDETVAGKSVVVENLQKSRQANFSPGQNLRQSDVNMDETSPAQPHFMASKSIVDPLEQSRGLQKSRQTSFAVHQMDETLAGHAKSVLVENQQKSRQSNFAVQDMNETGRVSPGQNLPLSEVEIDERVWQLSRSQFGKSVVDPLEQSKALQKSRQTSFTVEHMDETMAGHAKPVLVENLPKSRHTVFQEAEMDQTRRDSGNHLQVNDQNAKHSRLEQSRASRIPTLQTSFAVQDMNETNAREEHQKSRQTSFIVENMNETSVDSSRLQRTTRIPSPATNNLQKSRQTTFHQAEMDQTHRQSPPLHIEETILQSPPRDDPRQYSQAPSLFQSTTTNHSTVVERPRQTALFNNAPIESDETTFPIHHQLLPKPTDIHSPHYNLEQSIKRHSRHTIYAQDSMDETPVGMPRTSDGYLGLEVEEEEERQKRTPPPPPNGAMSRKTVYCEDDMEQTTVGFRLRRVTDVEPVVELSSPVKERAPSPQIALSAVPHQPTRSRQTILAPQDMEQSMMQQSMEVSVIKSTPRKGVAPLQQQNQHHQHTSPSRRTIMPSENIAEDSFRRQRPIKLEQQDTSLASPCPSERDDDYGECSTVEMKQEKSLDQFSFTMPALPEDRVLRSCAAIPAYRMAPLVGRIGPAPKSLAAPPEELNASEFLAPAGGSRMTRIPMDELSEISGLAAADTSRLFRPTLPVSIMAGDVSTFAIKEVTEPSIPVVVAAASVPTPVIQETPRKISMIPVARRSRGSIFNRQSVDMDMSGVTAMNGDTPEGAGKVVVEEEVKPDDPAPEPANLNASEEDEFYDAETNPVPEEVPLVPITEQSTTMHLDVNQTAAGLKTLKFIDVDELEQTAWPQQQQKRQLSQISKSVLLEQECDPLNVSLSEDYPLKKRKTIAPTPPAKEPPVPIEDKPRKSTRRVTFQPEVDLETVTIKKEYDTIVEANETCALAEESRFDPSVFIVEEGDMLANESNISLVASAQESSSSTRSSATAMAWASSSKYDNSIYREYGNLTLNMDQLGSTIVISDDSMTAPTDQPAVAPIRLTLADLPKRIRKTRESLVLNSTVASEVMYEINHELSSAAAQRPCCSFKGNCNCQRPRRTMAVVRLETVETVREAWETNLGRILESVTKEGSEAVSGEVNDLPLDERIREILTRPMKEPLPLPCLERIQAGELQQHHLPEVPSVWFLSENFLKSTVNDITCSSSSSSSSSSEVFTPYMFPATPSPTALVRNRLETQGFRWFLDSSCEASERRLYLRHRTLRTLLLMIQLQKSPAECAPEEHVRIERMELVDCREKQYVPSTRLLAAHAEFMEIGPKNVRDVLSSMCTSTAHLMSLVVHLDSLVEQVLGKVDQLWRIVKNNGAVMEEFGTDRRLRISKYFEYQHEQQSIHWNRLEVQFDAIDRIERSSVSFHRSNQHCESLFPTEQQCGKSGLQGLVFLECLLWNVEKCSVEC